MFPNCTECIDFRHKSPECSECANQRQAFPNCSTCINSRLKSPDCEKCIDSRHQFPCTICINSDQKFPDCQQCIHPDAIFPDCTPPRMLTSGQSIEYICKNLCFHNPPLVPNQAFMPRIKAMNVPFHLLYGSQICSKRLQSDRQKCGGILAAPDPPQKHI